MPITNPTAVRFSDAKIRVAANRLAQTYNFAKKVSAEWDALSGSALIPNNAAETIVDGAAQDGRPVITGAHANNVINRLVEMITDMEANGSAKLNTVLQVANNTGD